MKPQRKSVLTVVTEIVLCLEFNGYIARYFICGHGEVVEYTPEWLAIGVCRLCSERRTNKRLS